MDTPVHIKISVLGKDENRKFKLSLKDCSANVLPDKVGSHQRMMSTDKKECIPLLKS